MIKVGIIGECMVELKEIDGALHQGFGGDTLNTAIYLTRLTNEIKVSYLTGVGKDSFTDKMLSQWELENIDISSVRKSKDKQNGIYSIQTSEDGERTFNYWRNDSAAKFWIEKESTNDLIAELSKFNLIYLSGITLAILTTESRSKLFGALSVCKKKGVKIAFDNNYRPSLWQDDIETRNVYAAMLNLTDIAFLTFDDEQALWGDEVEQESIKRTQDFGVDEIVIKRGKGDCYVVTNELYKIPACHVSKVIDTTAAGDSFSAGYLAKRLTGGSCKESAVIGHRLASTVIQFHGAIIPRSEMPTMESKDLNARLAEIKIVPVIVINDADKAVSLAKVLVENGLPCAEVTFRTKCAAQAIKNMREAYPEMLIGAGTILKPEQVDEAIEAGVDFIVSPSINPEVVKLCQSKNIPIIAGVNNPYLVEKAIGLGLDTIKFFPAEPSGGVPMLKSLCAVYQDVKFMPTGGISPNNVNDYLAIPNVICCGGSWMVPTNLIDECKWDELAELIK